MTTYFSDYILVPHKSVRAVTRTLESRGFTFSQSVAAYVSQDSPTSPSAPRHGRQSSAGNPFDFADRTPARPSTPPPSTVTDLQAQTFMKLKQAGIVPTVDTTIRLVSCAGRKEADPALDAELRDDLLQILLSTCPPTAQPPHHETAREIPPFSTRFLSLSLTSDEPLSLLLESSLLSNPKLSLATNLLFSQSSAQSAHSTPAAPILQVQARIFSFPSPSISATSLLRQRASFAASPVVLLEAIRLLRQSLQPPDLERSTRTRQNYQA